MNRIHFGDCRDGLRAMAAAGKKVQMCVSSPPYFGLRDYGHDGQIGLEETPEQYIAELVEVFRAVREVLADDGTLWVNIGDSYAGAGYSNNRKDEGFNAAQKSDGGKQKHSYIDGFKNKDLIGIPWMLAFALRSDGWYLRQDIIWHKPNPMPESVTDRCTKAHEYLFLLSKSPRYYYDAEAVKEDAVYAPAARSHQIDNDARKSLRTDTESRHRAALVGGQTLQASPDGKRNRRSVWTIPTKPYAGAHFAVMAPALLEPCILAGTSERGHCPECGARWIRQVERSTSFESGSGRAGTTAEQANASGKHIGGVQGGNKNLKLGPLVTSTTTDWMPTCACGGDPVPDTVLDPFMGSGTTAAVAILLGRDYAGCELNPDYKPLQDQRIAEASAERAEAQAEAARRAAQLDLFAVTAP